MEWVDKTTANELNKRKRERQRKRYIKNALAHTKSQFKIIIIYCIAGTFRCAQAQKVES